VTGYCPELYASAELGDSRVNYYQGLIGVLRWMIELGRIDILASALLSGETVSEFLLPLHHSMV
jgi:hypothetical protein